MWVDSSSLRAVWKRMEDEAKNKNFFIIFFYLIDVFDFSFPFLFVDVI